MIGGIELGGTKCIVAVANNPLEIVEKKVISTRDPSTTISEIVSFFDDFQMDSSSVFQGSTPSIRSLIDIRR